MPPDKRGMEPIAIRENVTPQVFAEQIRPLGEPAVLKGLVRDWPSVAAGRQGDAALIDYLVRSAAGTLIDYSEIAPEYEGRFHYRDDLKGLNFERRSAPLAHLLKRLAEDRGPGLAAQGVAVPDHLPGFHREQQLALLPPQVVPRIWIGNRIKVATHTDPSENIACVVAGRRRFTLFAPEQIGNLYMGPFHFTPAGTPISMVHLTAPDLDRYPRFADALAAARTAELEPGDAIYIPYQWFHHVESLDRVSVLVNYWWDPARRDLGSPWDAMFHGMIALRNLPPDQRRAWQAWFEHYVFLANGDPGTHLPDHARGVLGAFSPREVADQRAELNRNLQKR